jgi:hypothetical protein
MGKRYHGFHCGDGWIIESHAAPDKQTCVVNEKHHGNSPRNRMYRRTSDAQLWDAKRC